MAYVCKHLCREVRVTGIQTFTYIKGGTKYETGNEWHIWGNFEIANESNLPELGNGVGKNIVT